jgi:hypothetical protein
MPRILQRLLLFAVFAPALSCSLIIDSQLEDKGDKLDGKTPAVDANAGLEAGADTGAATKVTGENGNTGPFTIGERVTIQLTSAERDTVKLMVFGPEITTGVLCGGERTGDQFICHVGPLSVVGKNSYLALTEQKQVVETGSLTIQRLVAVGVVGSSKILLLDSETLETVQEVALPGKLSKAKRGMISPCGRYMLFGFDDPDNGNKQTLGLLDLVTKEVVSLKLEALRVEKSSFEPEFIGAPFAWHAPSRKLWAVDAQKTLREVGLPVPPATIGALPPSVSGPRRANVVRVLWKYADFTKPPEKLLVGIEQGNTQVFSYDPVTNKYASATTPPGGNVIDLAYARAGDGLESDVAVVSLDAAASSIFASVYGWSSDKLARIDNQQIDVTTLATPPDALTTIHATSLVPLIYGVYPSTLFAYAEINAQHRVDLKGTLMTVHKGDLLETFPVNYGFKRILVRSGEEISILSAGQPGDNPWVLTLKKFTKAGLRSLVHHHGHQRLYVLSQNVLNSYTYPKGDVVDLKARNMATPVAAGWVVIQP